MAWQQKAIPGRKLVSQSMKSLMKEGDKRDGQLEKVGWDQVIQTFSSLQNGHTNYGGLKAKRVRLTIDLLINKSVVKLIIQKSITKLWKNTSLPNGFDNVDVH